MKLKKSPTSPPSHTTSTSCSRPTFSMNRKRKWFLVFVFNEHENVSAFLTYCTVDIFP